MATGTSAWKGLGCPLNGEFEIKQVTLGTDIVTIRGVASQSGDFLVCRNSDLTEKFVVDVNGAVTVASTLTVGGTVTVPAGSGFGFTTLGTTAPTPTAAGQLFLLQASSAIQLGASNISNDMTYFALATTTAVS